MRWLVSLFALLPGAALAGGMTVIVEMPCYPEDKFDLCRVPIVDGHYAGYLPRTVPSHVTLGPGRKRLRLFKGEFANPVANDFSIYVTPNIVPYREAVQDAAMVAAAQCGRQGQEVVVARIVDRQRHAPENLESWKFSAICD
ncbi:hypothetical protein PARPLA_02953 [Rhodobacteraceae bacterium THAF1]|uniref:hypothetical protein n=1 Tax=Palleronia sp. THAF1 TaxID=2587842 RepID=UPI000F3F71C5|nr:hypothetical protein [Palleronia sp. THAF1]QFU08354.1 hypothetical protein FIU81_06675 [Palleronia sp. THAF1]VDC29032.1 hypothetical protein PARPLA_02953 [Rhodobacteraceae bacterium THAF1]